MVFISLFCVIVVGMCCNLFGCGVGVFDVFGKVVLVGVEFLLGIVWWVLWFGVLCGLII